MIIDTTAFSSNKRINNAHTVVNPIGKPNAYIQKEQWVLVKYVKYFIPLGVRCFALKGTTNGNIISSVTTGGTSGRDKWMLEKTKSKEVTSLRLYRVSCFPSMITFGATVIQSFNSTSHYEGAKRVPIRATVLESLSTCTLDMVRRFEQANNIICAI